MSLRIGVDAWNLPGDHRGIGRYTRSLLRCWSGYGRDHVALTLIIPEWPVLLHAQRYRQELGGLSIPVIHRGAVSPKAFDLIWFPWNGMSWIPPGIGVATLHDASLFALPPDNAEIREREQRPLRVAAATATQIITDSHYSKGELSRLLNIEPNRIDVVHLGVDPVRIAPGPPPIDGDYILFVGEIEPRKGLDVLEAALTRFNDPPLLVIAGRRTAAERAPDTYSNVVARSPVANAKYLGHVTDGVLASLYAGAKCVVYPSRYEGFGLPLVEAMASGTPVLASRAASIPEVVGESGVLLDPDDPTQWADAIVHVMTDPILRARLRTDGQARAATFTWERTARITLDVYQRVASK